MTVLTVDFEAVRVCVCVCVCVPVIGAQPCLPGSVLAVGVVGGRLACVLALALLLHLKNQHRILDEARKSAAAPPTGQGQEVLSMFTSG